MKQTMEELAILLNSRKNETADGVQIARLMESAYNCYGSYGRMSKELWEELTPSGKKRLMTCISLAAMQMSHEWKCCGFDSWDDRKKASLSFSFNNSSYFEKLFEKNAGFPLQVVDRGPCFWDCVCSAQTKDTFMEGFLSRWTNVHSTLKQAFFGGMVRGVLVENAGVTFVPPLNYGEVVFPFY